MTMSFRISMLLLVLSTGPALAVDVAATLAWSQKVELGTLVSGMVSKVHVRPGQVVKQGDALITLDDRGFRSQVGSGLAAYRHTKANLEEAEREDERALELYDRTVLSDFERNQALIALQSARAAHAAAQAALVAARLDLERSVVRAPFDGIVLSLNVAPGQTVISELQSQALVALADHRTLLARAQIDGARAGELSAGQALRATWRGQSLEARVSHVGFEPVAMAGDGPRYELVTAITAPQGVTPRVGEPLTLHLD